MIISANSEKSWKNSCKELYGIVAMNVNKFRQKQLINHPHQTTYLSEFFFTVIDFWIGEKFGNFSFTFLSFFCSFR